MEEETHKAPVNEDTQEKDEKAASVMVAAAAEVMATGVTSSDASAKDDAAQKALKVKAFHCLVSGVAPAQKLLTNMLSVWKKMLTV